jgi:hypothetical protein
MSAMCECGCGKHAPISPQTDHKRGRVKGQPFRFCQGHGKRKDFDTQYEIMDAGHTSLCWIWVGGTRGPTNRQYGVYHRFDGSRVGAHVFSVERSGREIPVGMEVDHLCRVPLCVNPDHLEVVSHLENVRRSRRAKLTIEDARQIRQAPEGCRRLARRYGVSPTTIMRIREGSTWVD